MQTYQLQTVVWLTGWLRVRLVNRLVIEREEGTEGRSGERLSRYKLGGERCQRRQCTLGSSA